MKALVGRFKPLSRRWLTLGSPTSQSADGPSACVPRSRDGNFQVRCAAFPFSPPSSARRWRVTPGRRLYADDLHARLFRTSLLARSREPKHAVLDEEQVLKPVLDEAVSEIPHPKHELEQFDVPGPRRRNDARSADSVHVEDWRAIYRAPEPRVHYYCQRTVSRTYDTHVLWRCARPHLNSLEQGALRAAGFGVQDPAAVLHLALAASSAVRLPVVAGEKAVEGNADWPHHGNPRYQRQNRAFEVAFVGPSSNPTLTCVAAWCIAAHPLRCPLFLSRSTCIRVPATGAHRRYREPRWTVSL